jgi:hypothetical protein
MKYFMVLESVWFRQLLNPALAECWRTQNFQPAATICRELASVAGQSTQTGSAAPISLRVPDGIPFRRDLWRMLAGELLLFGAKELPELETPLDSYAAVLHQTPSDARAGFPPIQQAIQGSQDLHLGAYYRPEHAGWNDEGDARRLAAWLLSIDTAAWKSDDLIHCAIEDRDDELAFLREWFPPLREMYRNAADSNRVIVCEEM